MASFSKFVKVCVCWGGTSKVVSYKYEGAAPHAVALNKPFVFFNTESGSVDEAWKKKRTCVVVLFNTESGSVDEAWKKKRTCIVLLYYTLEHYVWCIVCYYGVIKADSLSDTKPYL